MPRDPARSPSPAVHHLSDTEEFSIVDSSSLPSSPSASSSGGIIHDVVRSITEPLMQSEDERRHSLPFNDGLLLVVNITLSLLMLVWMALIVMLWRESEVIHAWGLLVISGGLMVAVNVVCWEMRVAAQQTPPSPVPSKAKCE